jgi:hypothetical protein
VRADEQKLHRRLSPGASGHMITKPKGTRDRVNAAVVHREIMNLFGEIGPAWRRRSGEGRLEAGPYPIMRFLLDD